MTTTTLARRGPALVLLDEDCFPIDPDEGERANETNIEARIDAPKETE